MLCITRRPGESIIVQTPSGDKIEIVVIKFKGNQARVGIKAERETLIHRAEFFDDDGKLMEQSEYQEKMREIKEREADETALKAANRIKKNKSIIGLLNG